MARMSTRLVKGTAVFRLRDGKKLGLLDHVYFDPGRQEVAAISFRTDNILPYRRSSHLIAVDAIGTIGIDAVTVISARMDYALAPMEPVDQGLLDLDEVIGRPVMTDDGTMLGRVMAVRFDRDDYRLTHIGVAEDDRQPGTLIPTSRILQFGTDVIVVGEPVLAPSPASLAAVA
jgi:sporulation protein YlmC with PRC-barrel domain